MKKVRVTGLLIMAALLIPAFEAYSQAGGSAVPFLRISPDARASGMGEVGTAVADDINAIFWNPGGLAFLDYFNYEDSDLFEDEEEELQPYRQFSVAFSPWLPQFNADLFYSYGTYGQRIEALNGTMGVNFIFMNLGEFTRTSDQGKVLGKFISNEFSLGLSYGTIVAKDLGVGVQLKYIQSMLTPTSVVQGDAGTGISVAFDLGALWKPSDLPLVNDNLSLGINLQNIGPKITYVKESDPLPTTLRMGAAYKAIQDEFNDLTFALDVSKLLVKRDEFGSDPLPRSLITGWENPGVEVSFGAEYWYERIVAFRAGYFTEPAALGDRQFWTLGAGVKYDRFSLDFGYILTVEENHPLANTMRFSFLFDWR